MRGIPLRLTDGKTSPPAASPTMDAKPSSPAAPSVQDAKPSISLTAVVRSASASVAFHTQGLRPSSPIPPIMPFNPVPPPPSHLQYFVAIWNNRPNDIGQQPSQVTLDDVANCIDRAKALVDLAAHRLTDEGHQRTTSAVRRQPEEILSASSDTEQEIADLKRSLQECEYAYPLFRRGLLSTRPTSKVSNPLLCILRRVSPLKNAAMQPLALAPPVVQTS